MFSETDNVVNKEVIMFLLGFICGVIASVITLMIYACIVASKKSEEDLNNRR